MKGIKISAKPKNELESFRAETKDKKEARRVTGILMRADKKGAKETAKDLGVTEREVFKWCQVYKKEGIKGIKIKKQTGRPAIQGNKAKKLLPKILKKEPETFGFLKGRWVVRDVAKALNKEGVKISFQQTNRILKEIKMVLKEPLLQAPGSIKKNYAKRRQIRNYQRIAGALKKNESF